MRRKVPSAGLGRISFYLVGALLVEFGLAATAVAAGDTVPVPVDCDDGDDLAQVIRKHGQVAGAEIGSVAETDRLIQRPREPLVILVSGECTGPLSIQTSNLTIRGTGNAILSERLDRVGPERNCLGVRCTPILEVRGATGVSIENLTIRGVLPRSSPPYTTAMHFLRSEVHVADVVSQNTEFGLWASSSTFSVKDSTLSPAESLQAGLVAAKRSYVSLEDTVVEDGLFLLSSDGTLAGGEVLSRRGRRGLDLRWNSSLDVSGAQLTVDGPPGHLVTDQSRLSLRDTRVTSFLVIVNDSSLVSSTSDLDTSLSVINNSSASIQSGSVNAITAREFSSVQMGSQAEVVNDVGLLTFAEARITRVGDMLTCDATSDAICTLAPGGGSTCSGCTAPIADDAESGETSASPPLPGGWTIQSTRTPEFLLKGNP